jgi:hypothetical protein
MEEARIFLQELANSPLPLPLDRTRHLNRPVIEQDGRAHFEEQTPQRVY